MEPPNRKMGIDDFHTVSVIGKGGYAKVLLVKKKLTGEYFALKILKKEFIEKRKQEASVATEREILTKVSHPFVIHFHGSFQNEKKLYFVLEYCPGGELYNLLRKKKRFREDRVKFYAAQIVLALEHLHKQDVIYRDLKPENVLIDSKGYIRITDFGLSKTNTKDDSAVSMVGTREYFAPEILLKTGYGKAVDWWCLGSIIYEMIIGLPPFYTNNVQELYERIKFKNPKYPDQLPANLRSLLEGLLQKDPTQRLGYDSADSVKKHPWFENVNWNALLLMKYDAPFVPNIASDDDLQYFDRQFTESVINSMSVSENATNTQYKNYEGFTYDPDKDHSFRADDEMEGAPLSTSGQTHSALTQQADVEAANS